MDFVMLFSVIFIVLIMANAVVIASKPFTDDFKSTKKRVIFDSFLIVLFIIIVYFAYLAEKKRLLNPVYMDTFSSLAFVGLAALILVFIHEIIQTIYIFCLNKAGKNFEEFTAEDKPAFLKFFTDFKSIKSEKKDERKYLHRFRIIALPFMLCVYMYFIFGVTELYFANMTEWKFNFWDILPFAAIALIAGIVISAVMAVFLKGSLLDYISVFIAVVGIMSYIQANFLPQTTFIDGTADDISLSETVLNLFIWFAVIIAALYLYKFRSKATISVITYISMVLLLIQIVPLPVILSEGLENMSDKTYEGYSLDGEKQFEVSSKNNVIVFFMDTYHSGDFEYFLEKNPDYSEILSDFTYYDNVGTKAFNTAYCMPAALTGHDNNYEISIIDSNAECWNSAEAQYFYNAMNENGYKVRLYSDNDVYCGGAENMLGKIDNAVMYESYYITDGFPTYLKMAELSVCRYIPHTLKCFLRIDDSVEINQYTVSANYEDALNLDKWIESTNTSHERGICYLNGDYYNGVNNGFTASEEDNLCIFQHLHGMHPPYYDFNNNAGSYDVALDECMAILKKCIENLRELGVYDNSTIILTADHGYHNLYSCAPVMLIKPQGVTGERLDINSAPGVIQDDLLPTVLDCIGAEHDVSGYSLIELEENFSRIRVVRDFRYSSEFPEAKKCTSVGNSVFNCYYEYTYEGHVDSAVLEEKGVYPVVDFWW